MPSRWIFYCFGRLRQKAHPTKKRGHNARCRQGDTRIHGSMRPRYPSKLPAASVLRDRRKGPFDPNLLQIWERCTRHTKKRTLEGAREKDVLGQKLLGEKHGSFPTKDSKINRNHPSRYPGTQTATWALGQLFYLNSWANMLHTIAKIARQSQGAGSQNELTSWGSRKTAIHVQPGQVFGIFQEVGCFDRYVMQYCWLKSANHVTGSMLWFMRFRASRMV